MDTLYLPPFTGSMQYVSGESSMFRKLYWICHSPLQKRPLGRILSGCQLKEESYSLLDSYSNSIVRSYRTQWSVHRVLPNEKNSGRLLLSSNDYCRVCGSAEEEKTINFLLQCTFLARRRFRLFDSLILVRLMELTPIDIKDIASYIKLSSTFSVKLTSWPFSSRSSTN